MRLGFKMGVNDCLQISTRQQITDRHDRQEADHPSHKPKKAATLSAYRFRSKDRQSLGCVCHWLAHRSPRIMPIVMPRSPAVGSTTSHPSNPTPSPSRRPPSTRPSRNIFIFKVLNRNGLWRIGGEVEGGFSRARGRHLAGEIGPELVCKAGPSAG